MNEIREIHGITPLDDDTRIARYFNEKRLIDIIDKQEIWFSNIEEFHDKRERTIPLSFFIGVPDTYKQNYLTIQELKNEKIKAYVTCWAKFPSENYALWKIYDKESRGACLVTTVGKLKAALNRNDMFLCEVNYIDYNDKQQRVYLPWVIYDPDAVPNVMRVSEKFKIRPYKYEDEIRGIIYLNEDKKGFPVKVNLQSLIDEVYISPFSNKEQTEITLELLKSRFDERIIRISEIIE